MHPLSTQAVTGLRPVESNFEHRNALEMGSIDAPEGFKGLLHPNNPLMWFGVFLGVTFGLVGVSGSARLGKTRVSASLDKD